VFLAACAAGDRGEVKVLLGRGADIDTANVDGLTALHQVKKSSVADLLTF
jgi:protein phosphatase 1 regulatory subunit 12A